MATFEEAEQAIIDLIVEASKTEPVSGLANDRLAVHKNQAEAILKLAEARAWLSRPDQPH